MVETDDASKIMADILGEINGLSKTVGDVEDVNTVIADLMTDHAGMEHAGMEHVEMRPVASGEPSGLAPMTFAQMDALVSDMAKDMTGADDAADASQTAAIDEALSDLSLVATATSDHPGTIRKLTVGDEADLSVFAAMEKREAAERKLLDKTTAELDASALEIAKTEWELKRTMRNTKREHVAKPEQVLEEDEMRKEVQRIKEERNLEVLTEMARYQFYCTLGIGSFGTVFLCKKDKEYMAIKAIKKNGHLGEAEELKFEAMMAKEHMYHPSLCKYFKVLETKLRFYIIMEYLIATPATVGMEESTCQFYTAQLALGLMHMHHNKIVFRDMSMNNIMLDMNGNIKITDFGLASVDEGEGLRGKFGTPAYMSPEMVRGKIYHKETDWWSLGAVLYYMILGKPAFDGDSEDVIYSMIARGPNMPRDRKHFSDRKCVRSKEVMRLIKGLLELKPSKRLGVSQNESEVLKEPFFDGLDIDALKQGKVEPPVKPKFMRPKYEPLSNFEGWM